MQEFLESIQYSSFGLWVAGGDTILAYPGILVLHTVGLGVVVGSSAILNFRVLGLASNVPLADLRRLFRAMWWGFGLNAVTGVVLFIGAAADKGYQKVFWLKLGLIFFALVAVTRLRRTVYSDPPEQAVPLDAKVLAVASLVLWMGAIVAGRLMAYTVTF